MRCQEKEVPLAHLAAKLPTPGHYPISRADRKKMDPGRRLVRGDPMADREDPGEKERRTAWTGGAPEAS